MVLKMNEGWRKIIKFAHGANYKIVVARSSESTTFNKRALYFYHRSDEFNPCLSSLKISLDRRDYIVRWVPDLYVSSFFLYFAL